MDRALHLRVLAVSRENEKPPPRRKECGEAHKGEDALRAKKVHA
jgi:hypothetical protein